MAYDGTRYHGFQVQPNAPTVQGELERALGTICAEPVRVIGAGRTDTGVHASGQVVDFRTASTLGAAELGRGVNALLPEDIADSALEPAEESFHARYSATGRTYEYRIRNAAERDPLTRLGELWIGARLDVGAMRAASAAIVGRMDFSAFAAGPGGIRTVRRAEWCADGALLRFAITADAASWARSSGWVAERSTSRRSGASWRRAIVRRRVRARRRTACASSRSSMERGARRAKIMTRRMSRK